jgi:hypothetical protein
MLQVILVLVVLVPAASTQTPAQSQRLAADARSWVDPGATDYTYRLSVGGVFGAGEYRVEVRHHKCKSKHVGGIGLGKARFLDHFRTEPTCYGRLIGELLKQVQADVARGYTLVDFQIDAEYGYVKKVYLEASHPEDQGWGFEVSEFRLLSAKP